MMRWRKESFFLLIMVIFLSFSLTANAEERKGLFIRLWDRIKARIGIQKEVKPIEEKEELKKEEKAPAEPAPEKKKPPRKKGELPQKEEMVDTIKRRLHVFSEIVNIIPGLSASEKTEAGVIEYYYRTPDGVTMELEELDKDTLYRLYVKVNQEATRIHTERLLRQIRQQEQLQRLQNLQRMQQGPPRPPAEPPKAPKVYTPPKPPSLPPKPPPTRD
jgi:hypothetical protein